MRTYRSVAFLTKALKQQSSDANLNSSHIFQNSNYKNSKHTINKLFSTEEEKNPEQECTLNSERSGFITERSGLECSGLSCRENP